MIIHGDCLAEMQKLIDDGVKIDAVITDPPYGIGEASKDQSSRGNIAAAKNYKTSTWDDERVPEFIPLALSVSKEQIIFGGNYYADLLPPSSSWIVWDKQNGTNDFADCELIWTSHKKAVRKIEWLWNGMIRKGNEEKTRVHPTQKPAGLMRIIIERYTNKGDTILDPFMGSGTTGVACAQLGRKFIGIEIDEDYYKIAKQRIELAYAQKILF